MTVDQIQRTALRRSDRWRFLPVLWWHVHNGHVVSAASTKTSDVFSFRGLLFTFDVHHNRIPLVAALKPSSQITAIQFYDLDLTADRIRFPDVISVAVREAAERNLRPVDGVPWQIHGIDSPRARKSAVKAFLDARC